MRAHLQGAGPNLTSSPTPFQIRFVSPSTALQQDLSPDLAACGCRKKKKKHFLTNFPPTRPNAQCCAWLFDPRQQVPLANGTTNACSSSKCEVKLELAFEYLMSKDRLQWVTITSQQVGGATSGLRDGCKSPDSADVRCYFRLSWWASACSQWWTSWWWRNQAAALKRSVSHDWQKAGNELEIICSRRNICITQLISIPPWILISSSPDAEEATQRLHLPSR